MGTPEFAVGTLRRLVEGGYNVVAVVTRPDKPTGRHAVLTAPAVKQYAASQGIPILQPEKMKDEAFLTQLAAYHADVQVVAAFRMLPEAVWAMPRFGTFNVHASLLPQYRGAAPINWAIINGETETGVTTFFLDREIDTGRVILQKRCPLPDDADAARMYAVLTALGADAAEETLELVLRSDGTVPAVAQDNPPMLRPAPKLFKETCLIDWNRPAKRVYDFIRGMSPVPCARAEMSFFGGAAQTVKIFKTGKTGTACDEEPGTVAVEKGRLFVAACDEWLEIEELQIAGKKRMAAADVVNGLR